MVEECRIENLSHGRSVVSRWAGVYRVKSHERPTRVEEVGARFAQGHPQTSAARRMGHASVVRTAGVWQAGGAKS